MKRIHALIVASVALFEFAASSADAGSPDPLAPRDKWGRLHQCPDLNETDFARRRYHTRFSYYTIGSGTLLADPAYVGALQTALNRRGYYSGQIDGVYSPAVNEAIARLQKNHSMRVTGNMTIAVRRALHLP